jgi:hypothetical protein
MLSALSALTLAWAPQPRAEDRSAEYQIKAAFLYKFGGYVEWPVQAFERTDAPVVIGVVGAQQVLEEIRQTAAGRSVNGRAVTVRRLRPGDPVEGVHILFVAGARPEGLEQSLSRARGQAVLTVTEAEDPGLPSGIINFVVIEDKVRFVIAPQQAESSNLKISARLLSVAYKVIARPS